MQGPPSASNSLSGESTQKLDVRFEHSECSTARGADWRATA